MKYTEKHFEKCRFNPLEDNLLAAYPELEEFCAKVGVDASGGLRQLRYIIMMYDPASPIHGSSHVLAARKMTAALMSGFDYEKETMLVESMFQFLDPEFTRIVNLYLARFVQTKPYIMLQTLEQVWWEYNEGLLKRATGDNSKQMLEAIEKKSKLRIEMEAIVATMDKFREQFYGKDEVLMEQSAKHKISAESIADVL